MVGAGVFSAFTPAAAAAGSGLLVGLVVAAVVAWCNATASAQLAAQYPTSGGTYVYGRERLGPWWGFVAGWGFVVGKTASCAAMALTVATYAVGGDARATRFLAIAAVVGLTVVNLRGITETARLATVLVVLTIGILGVTLVAIGVANRTWHSPFESTGDVVRIRDPAVRRAAVLRVRRVCADRHPGRGGARPGDDDPAGHPASAGDRRRPLRRGGGGPPRRPRPGRRGGVRPAAARRRRPGGRRAGWARPSAWRPSWPASVPCSGSSRASAGRCWRWRGNATCPPCWRRSTSGEACPRRRRRRSAPWWSCSWWPSTCGR